MRTIETTTPDETVAAGRELADELRPGAVVALSGDLGAGKTHFVRGLAGGWGAAEPATSPTFALLHEYDTPRGKVCHLDLYRAKDAEEVWSAVHDELGAAEGLLIVEWADRFPELLPPDAVRVDMAHAGEGRRRIIIRP
ncbi:MAG: tRNA (adenosine(37)-N6)-threonylcarbamoyltransferase complex ATPase subunit type 1 TsaE [Chthoniobacterales bacterium]|jgi:tRNA threonylcarbamoyladenosine biosynthesis protein TsaE|nr:tRNA (adenosine(37)-N6)-threonylcarbamoyltransferase complex ATPase subunit type 1 TsaE [Chthoniobacterales bacterium]